MRMKMRQAQFILWTALFCTRMHRAAHKGAGTRGEILSCKVYWISFFLTMFEDRMIDVGADEEKVTF